LATKFTTPIDRDQLEAASPFIIQDHFAKLRYAMKTKIIQEPDVYNMDEKGFLTGLVQASKVICSYEGGSKFKIPDNGN